jgi:hypothetical protein
MKKTPARNTACELAGIDFQNAYCVDHESAPAIARSIVRWLQAAAWVETP